MRNRLTSVTRSGSGQVISYAYDAEGFMVGITTGGQTERLTVDPHGGARSQVLVRNHGDGTKTRQVYGLGLLYEVREDGSVRYYHYDSLGSTVALTDAAGTITGRVQYGTFGAVATSSGDGLSAPWLWHGRHGVWTDKNTGMHQMRARWYSSALRRFLNPDPAGFAGGSNFYLYANGDPVSMIDPFGLGAQKADSGHGFFVGSMLNGDMLDDSMNLWHYSDPSTVSGFLGRGFAVFGMVAGVVDALGNVVTLGGKGAVTGGIKAGVKGVAKAEVKNVAEDMAVGIIKSSADDILETGGKFIQKKPGQFGQFKGVDALKAENKFANDAAKAAKLTQDQARELHDQISGQGLTYQQILELAWAIKNGH